MGAHERLTYGLALAITLAGTAYTRPGFAGGERGARGAKGANPEASPGAGSGDDTTQPAKGQDRTAVFERFEQQGQLDQMAIGTITINKRSYPFRTGGHKRGNLPPGEYTITPHLWSRKDASMTVDGVGWSFAMSDKHDPRVGAVRKLLRIHPDGGTPGTEGCMGIVGNGQTMTNFRDDMRAELDRGGGSIKLTVR